VRFGFLLLKACLHNHRLLLCSALFIPRDEQLLRCHRLSIFSFSLFAAGKTTPLIGRRHVMLVV